MSTLGIVLLIVLVLLLFGSFPVARSRSWGYGPSGLVGVLLVVVLVLVLLKLL